MAFIRTIPEAEAAGPTRELYDQDLKAIGYVPNYTQALGLRPEIMHGWRGLSRAIRANMDVRRYELITVIAAATLRCTY